MNVEIYQNQINEKYGTKFHMPVVYYSTLMTVAYGKNAKQAGLDGRVIAAKRLEEIAEK
jgi:heterodisulfide reductase subunit B